MEQGGRLGWTRTISLPGAERFAQLGTIENHGPHIEVTEGLRTLQQGGHLLGVLARGGIVGVLQRCETTSAWSRASCERTQKWFATTEKLIAEAWVELRYENEPTVRIVALFAGDGITDHEKALRRLVSHPDRLEVRPSPWTRVRLEEIRAAVQEMATASSAPGLFSGWGTGGGRVHVRLRADGERVAARLREQYGDAVDVTIGFLRFPECAFPPSVAPLMADPGRPGPLPLPDELHISLDEDWEVQSGADLRSRIRLVNEGDLEVVAHTNGQLTASVVDPTTNETVGGFSGAQTLPLVLFRRAGRRIGRDPRPHRYGVDRSPARVRRSARSMGCRDHAPIRGSRALPSASDPAAASSPDDDKPIMEVLRVSPRSAPGQPRSANPEIHDQPFGTLLAC